MDWPGQARTCRWQSRPTSKKLSTLFYSLFKKLTVREGEMPLGDSRYQFGVLKHVFICSFIDHIDSDSAQGNHCTDSLGLHMAPTRGIQTTHGTKGQYQMGPQSCQGSEYTMSAQEPGGARNRFGGWAALMLFHAPRGCLTRGSNSESFL